MECLKTHSLPELSVRGPLNISRMNYKAFPCQSEKIVILTYQELVLWLFLGVKWKSQSVTALKNLKRLYLSVLTLFHNLQNVAVCDHQPRPIKLQSGGAAGYGQNISLDLAY